MTDRIAVVSAAPAYVGVIKHPIDGMLKNGVNQWTYDGFTCRMLIDGVIFRAPDQAAAAAAAAPAPAAPAEAQVAPTA